MKSFRKVFRNLCNFAKERYNTAAERSRHNAGSGGAFGQDFADAANLCADALELLFNPLIATVDVVNAVENGLAISHEGRDHERCRGAKIGALHRGRTQRGLAANN